jgi:hypothetical protein
VEIYTVNLSNAALTPVGVVYPVFFTSTEPDSAIASLTSMDFDPSVDRLRVALATNSNSTNTNLANVDAFDALQFDLVYDVPTSIVPSLTAVAYSNNGPLTDPATPATWYGYDANTDTLVQPVQVDVFDFEVSVADSVPVTLDGFQISPTQYVGFDISGATGIGYFSMQDDQTLEGGLYTIGLSGPSAGVLNPLYDFSFPETVVEITVVPVPEPSTLVGGLLGAAALVVFRRRRG